jgi:dienelactone hydrolase
VAALVIDTYGPRGVSETVSDQQRVSIFAQVNDAFAGLKMLAADPRIDRRRIGIMGFSRGAIVANDTALESLRGAMAGNDLRFAARIPLYAGCNFEAVDRATDKAPMLFLHGEADNFTPIGPCRTYAKWFEKMGSTVTFVGYPGANHSFDMDDPVFELPNARTLGSCDARYDVEKGRFVRLDHVDNPQMTAPARQKYFESCAGTGAKVGNDAKGQQDAIVQVHRFLVATLHAR